MMMEDDKLFNRNRYIFFNNKYFILLKIFGLYCAVVCKRGGNACIDVAVGSDG